MWMRPVTGLIQAWAARRVGGLELGERAVLDDASGKLMAEAAVEHVRVGE
jgi:hypothetical protein